MRHSYDILNQQLHELSIWKHCKICGKWFKTTILQSHRRNHTKNVQWKVLLPRLVAATPISGNPAWEESPNFCSSYCLPF